MHHRELGKEKRGENILEIGMARISKEKVSGGGWEAGGRRGLRRYLRHVCTLSTWGEGREPMGPHMPILPCWQSQLIMESHQCLVKDGQVVVTYCPISSRSVFEETALSKSQHPRVDIRMQILCLLCN